MKKPLLTGAIIFALTTCATFSFAASIEKATVLSQHGLTSQAKEELIDVLFSKTDDNSKAQALYMLGSIAFDERKVSTALDTWRDLVKRHPASSHAKIVKERINELSQIVGETAKETVDN